MIDSHCHLADDAFAEDLQAVVDRAISANIASALCILSADEADEVARAAVVRHAWPAIRFAAGVHPHRAGAYAGRAAAAANAAGEAIDTSSAVAVGEIGLDYHYDFSPQQVQREVFELQLALAIDRKLPVIIHAREAAEDTHAILRAAGSSLRGVMHCFTGSAAEARRFLDLGLFISFAGMLTFPKAADLRDVARHVPLDRILLETDAPFLAPVPYRGKRNEPGWVTETFQQLAAIKEQSLEATAAAIVRNFDMLVSRS